MLWVAVSLFLALPGNAAGPPGPIPLPEVVETLKTLRKIEGAVLRGESDALRIRYQEQVQQRPQDPIPRLYVSWCLGVSDEGWNTLKGYTTTYPFNPWFHVGMGRIYLKWKMRDPAKQEFTLALKFDKAFVPALLGLGDVARVAGDLPGAEAKYREVLALTDDAEAHAGLGQVLLAQGKEDAAKAELQKAVAQWPDQPAVLVALTGLARKAGDLKAAGDAAEKLAALSPKDAVVRRTLADLRYEAGDKAVAAKEYERLLRLGAMDADVLKRLVEIYAAAGNDEAEERSLQQLSVLEKAEPAYPLRMAELAEKRGQAEEAGALLQEAQTRAPNRVDIPLRMARLLMKAENLRPALEAYRAAQAATEGEKPPELATEAAAVSERLKLPKKQVKGTVDQIYGRVSGGLNAIFVERLKERPDLMGTLKIRVRVDKDGKVAGVDILEDSVRDPVIEGHVYFALLDAVYPKAKREPVFEFELKPPTTTTTTKEK